MKAICRLLVLLFLREAFAAVARRPPAFAKPVYSDAYLPAAMQVIFHAVEQLKALQAEEANSTMSVLSSTTEKVEETTLPIVEDNIKETEMMETAETATEVILSEENPSNVDTQHSSTSSANLQDQHQESPEMHEEIPEMNYATPETNYETPEVGEQVEETNEEIPEVNEEESSGSKDFTSTTVTSSTKVESPKEKKKQPTVDSIIEEIYEIVKPTSTDVYDDVDDDDDNSKSVSTDEKLDMLEEQEEEDRFTMLGEKVTQVPRPSLSSYLKRAQVESRASLKQLASLYDALGKDARKQGYGKYFGYADEVLQVLESSAESGIGPQLKSLLDKILERNELTREDARSRTRIVLRDLEDPASELSKDLRRVLPLRFSS
ncbi:hypothetical protein KPH14_004846 [Odynerus spinipes]|uniref:Uncharacterized protein n=1 Tax=Odynerus spinipes TaxID=1348599 RepID=A0AAD9RMN0_9HYME|nr:hypothetical protein KPH14_004846 [Odynerus spinipes]